jgi:hypothetical protein
VVFGSSWSALSGILHVSDSDSDWTQGRQVYENSQTIDESDLEFLPKPTPPGAASCHVMTPLNDATLLKSFLCPSATAVQHFSEAVSNPQRIRMHYSSAFLCAWVLASTGYVKPLLDSCKKQKTRRRWTSYIKLHQATSSCIIQACSRLVPF